MDSGDLSVQTDEDATNFSYGLLYTETIFTGGGADVVVYLDLVILLNFLIDWLLLMGANRLTGYPSGWKRTAAAAGVGSVYAGICMLPGCGFLGNIVCRIVVLALMSVVAFGCNLSALRKGTIFVLLSMALGGMAIGLGTGSFPSLLLSAAGVAFLCAIGVKSPLGIKKYQPVELCWMGNQVKLMALVDTGNTLRDPITGEAVLIVGMDVGMKLGISREIINDPVSALAAAGISGARLIPYRAVGKPGGMMLLIRLEQVRLNGQNISPMVAFAPEEIGRGEGFQALAGGIL
ncbi:MAG: hypothetical protein E7462_04825 [Ruminococcaceae bacterium]|nr:hypothetical protein [Oscillospiraceae bacterium]